MRLQAHLFLQFTKRRLFCRFIEPHAALRKLPAVVTHPPAPTTPDRGYCKRSARHFFDSRPSQDDIFHRPFPCGYTMSADENIQESLAYFPLCFVALRRVAAHILNVCSASPLLARLAYRKIYCAQSLAYSPLCFVALRRVAAHILNVCSASPLLARLAYRKIYCAQSLALFSLLGAMLCCGASLYIFACRRK